MDRAHGFILAEFPQGLEPLQTLGGPKTINASPVELVAVDNSTTWQPRLDSNQ